VRDVRVDLKVNEASFADTAGLRAGERLAGHVKGQAQLHNGTWSWDGEANWDRGDLYWQPLYLADGGHSLQAHGSIGTAGWKVDAARLQVAKVGAAEASGLWNPGSGTLTDLTLKTGPVDMANFYPLVKPFLATTPAAQLQVQGSAELNWRIEGGTTRRFDLKLAGVDVADSRRRFKLEGVNLRFPWVNDRPVEAVLDVVAGELQGLPTGKTQVRAKLNGYDAAVASLSIPILDGRLNLEDLHAARKPDGWRWEFRGGLTPVSMSLLSDALKLPKLAGTLSGVIPKVSYSNQVAQVSGALLFRVFDGTVVVKELSVVEPLGVAPRLRAEMEMRNLDLDLLTQTYSFGQMQGRIDAVVGDLELQNWRPARFTAKISSSAGSYPKKISQQAVQNISSLGGAGGVGALQRSFLRIFEQFGYSKIGLSCVLRNNVCEMTGLEETPQGFIIIKGSGIPAITVKGFNRMVGWNELIERLSDIRHRNAYVQKDGKS
jgi:hypothetical protein